MPPRLRDRMGDGKAQLDTLGSDDTAVTTRTCDESEADARGQRKSADGSESNATVVRPTIRCEGAPICSQTPKDDLR